MNDCEDNKCVDQTRRNLIPAALVAIAGMGLPLTFAAEANAEEAEPQLMFVQLSEGLKVENPRKLCVL